MDIRIGCQADDFISTVPIDTITDLTCYICTKIKNESMNAILFQSD